MPTPARLRLAVIVTHDRPDDFRDCLAAIRPQVDHVIVVSHRANYTSRYVKGVTITYYADEIPNISKAWNLGLYAAQDHARHAAAPAPYDVAVLNDDAIVPPDWFRWVTEAMRDQSAAAGSAARAWDPRMCGYAFILDGQAGLFADEQFEWWYGDDDLERRAHLAGGVAQVPGVEVEHRHPNSTTVGVLADKAAQDRERFHRKWP